MFVCLHCGSPFPINPRQKGKQKYCSKKKCQQARKNAWEREKCKKDPSYQAKRQEAKRKSYRKCQGAKYQSDYRRKHPKYSEANRKKQHFRNQNRRKTHPPAKIVKTDAFMADGAIPQGIYELFPYENKDGEKIVKTDMITVQLRYIQDIEDSPFQQSA